MRSRATLLAATAAAALGCTSQPASSGGGKTVVLGKGRGPGVAAPATPGKSVPAIKVDTVGYPTRWRKIVVFNVDPIGAVVKDSSGREVLTIDEARVRRFGDDAASGDPVWQVDLGDLTTPGRYVIHAGEHASDPFLVADDVYDEPLAAGVKSFYFQRCRTALTGPSASWKGAPYVREKPCHDHDDVGWDLTAHPDKDPKRRWKMVAGWHDAGNYDMYVPSTAPSAQALLLAYEWAPDAFDDGSAGIPESGNGVPDVLDEVKWGLRWVLSMQEPSGAFRARDAVMEWSPEDPPDRDATTRWVSGPSSAATAKAVAVLALAWRIYTKHDDAFARDCAAAARKGWSWLVQHPERVLTDGKGSPQPLWDDEPGNTDVGARFVAAVETWRAFRDRDALDRVRKLLDADETKPGAFLEGSWANVSRFGIVALALDDSTPKELREEARRRILAAVDALRDQVEKADGYRCAHGLDDYYWASSSILLEKTHLLAVAAKISPDAGWALEAARDQWHWVLGRNPNGHSMVTRVGRGPDRFYHMEWGPKEPPPPGFLIGGPNAQQMGFLAPGTPAKALLWDNPKPLRSGLPPHSLWHWKQTDLWDGGFAKEEDWSTGWWAVVEPDVLYSASFVLAAAAVR
jgi:endoglucanase